MLFIERHLSKLIIGLIAVALYLQWIDYAGGFYLMLAASLIAVIRLLYITGKTRRILSEFVNEVGVSIVQMLKVVAGRVRGANQELQKVVKALGAIAENNDLNVQMLEVEPGVATALHDLQSKLQSIKREESRRGWIAQGLAEIGEMRRHNLTVDDYAFQMTSFIVKYLEANQGVFYTLTDRDSSSYLVLRAAYAYGRKKHHNETVEVEVGEGLLGQTVLEKEMVVITEVPEDYIKITSGLGEALPRCIAIVPLLYRDNVFGAIELASFGNFESHHVEFIRKCSESIASELSGIQVQEQTRKLLEQSQQQTQELRSQEEELRQSMEEMQATQEEMQRKEIALNEKLTEIEAEKSKNLAILESCSDGVISFDEGGEIVFINKAGQEIFGYTPAEAIGNSIYKILDIAIEPSLSGEAVLKLKTGSEITSKTEINAVSSKGEELSLLLTPAKVKFNNRWLFTLFTQKISVDLF